MTARDVVKNAPNAVLWAMACGTLIVLGLIGAQVALTMSGHGSDDLTMLINNLYKIVTGLASLGGLAFGAAAAKSAHRVEQKVAPEETKTDV
jgi:hypothetical protein